MGPMVCGMVGKTGVSDGKLGKRFHGYVDGWLTVRLTYLFYPYM